MNATMSIKINGQEPETIAEHLVAVGALIFAGIITIAMLSFTFLLFTAPLWFIPLIIWLLI